MSTEKTLWIIEDMHEMRPVYESIFDNSKAKLNLKFFSSFAQFSESYHRAEVHPDLIIADIMLEDGNFIQMLNEANLSLNSPFLVASICDDYETIANAFEIGAIDYIIKPLKFDEVKAKVERHLVIIEERNIENTKTLSALRIELSQFTNMEIKIIESFNIQDQLTLHRNDLIQIIWKNIAIHPNTLDVHIYNLRKKLKCFNYSIKAIGNGYFKFIDTQS